MKRPTHPVCNSELETMRVFWYDTKKGRTVSQKPTKECGEWFWCKTCKMPVLVEYKMA